MNEDDFETITPHGGKVIVVPIKLAIHGFLRRTAWILAIYAVFAAGAVTLHWYAGTRQSQSAQSLRAWYLEHDQANGKQYHRGYTDWVEPATILGLATGIVLARSWMWGAELALWALFLSGGILALFPFYQRFFPELTGSANAVGYGLGVLQCGFFLGVGRVLTAYLLERNAQKKLKNNDSSA
jgi:hypothetical protein